MTEAQLQFRQARLNLGLTQRQLADSWGVKYGVSYHTIVSIENGRRAVPRWLKMQMRNGHDEEAKVKEVGE